MVNAGSPASNTHMAERVSYLSDLHTVYTEHTNNMMSFFLVGGGLVLNAVVQAQAPEFAVPLLGSSGLALVGVLTSLAFLGIHLRSTQLLRALENKMRRLEEDLFAPGDGFLLTQPKAPFFLRMRFLFPVVYVTFAVAFLGAGLLVLRS